ncbi:MAG: UDP-3-O-(3-hydroxymyristoyl)glucosamine N-acyltransferase [Bdellovibrionales bacterium]
MSVQIRQIVENFPDLVTLAKGSGEALIKDLRASENASAESLIFVGNIEHYRTAQSSLAKTWLVAKSFADKVPDSVQNVLVSYNVQLSMALIGKKFFPKTSHFEIIRGEKIHPSAQISKSARIGAGCIIGPGAVIGDDCVIGENCIVGANSIIEPGVKMGTRTHIHPLVYIGRECELGADCEIQPNSSIGMDGFGYGQDKEFNHYRITHYGRVILEDKVHLGSGVQVDRGTFLDSRIGSGTKIDNQCHFGHNIVIGKNTLITGGALVAGSVSIGSYCVIGGRTTVAGHLEIGDKIHLGGCSGVTKSIDVPGQYSGLPLQDLKAEVRTRASLKQLPSMVKNMRRVLKHLGLESSDQSE